MQRLHQNSVINPRNTRTTQRDSLLGDSMWLSIEDNSIQLLDEPWTKAFFDSWPWRLVTTNSEYEEPKGERSRVSVHFMQLGLPGCRRWKKSLRKNNWIKLPRNHHQSPKTLTRRHMTYEILRVVTTVACLWKKVAISNRNATFLARELHCNGAKSAVLSRTVALYWGNIYAN